ncbi:UNVERIFIED_CONTAM: hypothetical protein K2H54_056872 [Gekko kuhli]
MTVHIVPRPPPWLISNSSCSETPSYTKEVKSEALEEAMLQLPASALAHRVSEARQELKGAALGLLI